MKNFTKQLKMFFCFLILGINSIYAMNTNDKIAQAPMEQVNVTPVTFKNKVSGFTLAGIIYTPVKMNPKAKLPAIVVQGPMGSVKEQTQSLYAQILASKGYITMVYDYSYLGSSQGLPRGYEDPEVKANDIESAVDFILQYPNVDKSKIAAVGICGSGAYLPYAVTKMKSNILKAVVSVNPFEIIHTIQTKSEAELLKDKALYEEKGIATRINLIEEGSEGAAYYYNYKRGASVHWVPFVTWSELSWRKFFPTEEVKKLTTPYLVVAGENAFTREGAEKMFRNTKTTDKELFIVPKAKHFDMYDKEEYVSVIIPKIVEFIEKRF